ncbi:hypothetical protein [Cohnella fermenti]|uniref:hypothetical protein n=1 Tax=Cohnella fermenti TaxID=2565925 RepID=UPI001B3B1F33|nr:hypothetical protein [Cohnella fermenti]
MRGNNRRIRIAFVMALLVLTIAFGTSGPNRPGSSIGEGSCKAILEWVDFLMINGITYHYNDEGTVPVDADQLGEQVGVITYMLNNHACTDHVTKNGDAAFLPIGTAVYEWKGYKPEFRVVAGNKVYQVNRNPNASMMGDLLDIEGKTARVSLESGIDGSPIGDFRPEASEEFIRELLPLAYVGFDAVYEKAKHESGVFLRIHLTDGTSFRMVYYPQANGFTAGAFGTEALRQLIMTQRAAIKAAAGL